MKYRIVWILSDGRKKYSTTKGRPEEYEESFIPLLQRVVKRGQAYTSDFAFFGIESQLTELGFSNLIRIIDFEKEDFNSPLTNGVLI